MRHRCPVETITRIAVLVLFYLSQRHSIHLRIASRWNERRHAPHRIGPAPVARFHQELRVRAHEWNGHRHLRAIRQDELRALAKLLDDAEDVVPASGVEST